MKRIRLIHWNADEAAERVEQLCTDGYQVDFAVLKGEGGLRDLAADPPDAVVIDLHRLPSAGRDMGLFLRKQKSTRHLPLVFAGGDPAKVARIKELLPDGSFSSWSRIGASLSHAINHPRRRSRRLQDLRHRQDVVGPLVHKTEVVIGYASPYTGPAEGAML